LSKNSQKTVKILSVLAPAISGLHLWKLLKNRFRFFNSLFASFALAHGGKTGEEDMYGANGRREWVFFG